MGTVSTDTIAALEGTGVFVARLEGSESATTKAPEAAAPADPTVERFPADALAAAKTLLPVAEFWTFLHSLYARAREAEWELGTFATDKYRSSLTTSRNHYAA